MNNPPRLTEPSPETAYLYKGDRVEGMELKAESIPAF